MKCKAFERVLDELNQHPQRLKQWLEDKRPTLTEKKIILAYSWIRNNQNQKVLDEISPLPASEIDFVEAHRQLILGIASNNLSRFQEAHKTLSFAASAFERLQLSRHSFTANFNLFILALNRGLVPKMTEQLHILRSIESEAHIEDQRLARCEFIYATEVGDHKLAMAWLEKIEKDRLPESEIISHLVTEFIFYVGQEDLKRARDVLEDMRKHRKYQLSENFNYMKKLLDHITHDAPIYAYPKDFEQVPILHHQIQVIQSLEAVEFEKALEHWEALKKMSPESYGDDYQYKGRTCLFSLALKKHRSVQVKPVTVFENAENKVDKLLTVLSQHPGGIRKDHLYELIWGEHPDTKDDLQRLSRLIYKAKQAYGVEIQSKKGSYSVGALKKKKAV